MSGVVVGDAGDPSSYGEFCTQPYSIKALRAGWAIPIHDSSLFFGKHI